MTRQNAGGRIDTNANRSAFEQKGATTNPFNPTLTDRLAPYPDFTALRVRACAFGISETDPPRLELTFYQDDYTACSFTLALEIGPVLEAHGPPLVRSTLRGSQTFDRREATRGELIDEEEILI